MESLGKLLSEVRSLMPEGYRLNTVSYQENENLLCVDGVNIITGDKTVKSYIYLSELHIAHEEEHNAWVGRVKETVIKMFAETFTAKYSPAEHSMTRGIYQHWKGQQYLVVQIAKHHETEEMLVIYRKADTPADREDKMHFSRPMDDFIGYVMVNNVPVPRFLFMRYLPEPKGKLT